MLGLICCTCKDEAHRKFRIIEIDDGSPIGDFFANDTLDIPSLESRNTITENGGSDGKCVVYWIIR